MAVDILVPPLSQTMDTVILVEWLKQVGDPVVKGEPLFVIETDKARLDVESPAAGIVTQILAEPGAEVQVRSKIGLITAPHETELLEPAWPPAPIVTPAPQPAKQPPAVLTGPGGQPLPPARQNRLFASPRARCLAQEAGIPLAEVKPSGPQQMIVERDIKAYLSEQAAVRSSATPVARRMAEEVGLDLASIQPERPGARLTRTDVAKALTQQAELAQPERRWLELSATRRTIARRLVESQQTAAHVTLTRAVDATDLVHLKAQILAELSPADPRPTYTDFFVAIVARQLRQHPYLNATTDGERLGLSEAIHVGMAVDTERGLVVPVIRHADQMGLLQLARARTELVQRALAGALTPAELADGTFTLTNLGALGVDAFTPIINPPQVAVLGVGRIHPGPAVYQDELCIRQLLSLSLTVDHRVIDGAPAARFLADVARLIEKPQLWWL
jgi:pyruvate dehydrogenase E2 component (dihydrolipoamide acetyltransferase)